MSLSNEARLGTAGMIDNFALGVSHGLILLAVWRLCFRPDLDDDAAAEQPEGLKGDARA